MKLSRKDKAFYSGLITALALVALYDEETLYREIVNTCDEKELIQAAREEEELEYSGLIKYGYVPTLKSNR